MKWATRAGIHIDRAVCALLIRRDIDVDAEFVVLRGLSMTGDDAQRLAIKQPMFNGLYEYYHRLNLIGREPA